ncbi:alpha/beta hydrolase [Rhodococcus sp. GXMU-t2271]|uniref:alpha/beta fold hydrolase n=1 Tax=Rhodococcus sp. GXMU-t2271 TaxID=3059079 RepID=UPI00352B5F20
MTRKISTGVGSLAVRVRGQGPPAVLWHSLFVDERSWGRVEEEWSTERRVVSITGPGHGASEDPGRRYTTTECAAAAGTVLDELGVDEPVDWVGNAWGGHVGIVFATDAPSRCRTLVTLGTPVQALNRAERARTVFLLSAHRMLGPVGFIRSGVTNVLLSATTRERDPEAVALVEDCLVRADRAALRNAVVSISLHRPDLTGRLPGLPVPTLFVTGSDHKGWTPEQTRAASRLVPHASCAVVDGAAYLVPLEAPAETTDLIRRFWAASVPGYT